MLQCFCRHICLSFSIISQLAASLLFMCWSFSFTLDGDGRRWMEEGGRRGGKSYYYYYLHIYYYCIMIFQHLFHSSLRLISLWGAICGDGDRYRPGYTPTVSRQRRHVECSGNAICYIFHRRLVSAPSISHSHRRFYRLRYYFGLPAISPISFPHFRWAASTCAPPSARPDARINNTSIGFAMIHTMQRWFAFIARASRERGVSGRAVVSSLSHIAQMHGFLVITHDIQPVSRRYFRFCLAITAHFIDIYYLLARHVQFLVITR